MSARGGPWAASDKVSESIFASTIFVGIFVGIMKIFQNIYFNISMLYAYFYPLGDANDSKWLRVITQPHYPGG